MSSKINPPWLVGASLVAAAILSIINVASRYQAEQSNRAVTIIVEAEAAADLAGAEGLSVGEGYRKLAEAGVGMVSCNERTAGELLSNGLIELDPMPGGRYRLSGLDSDLGAIEASYRARFGQSIREGEEFVIRDPQRLRSIQLGLNEFEVRAAREAGLVTLARIGNPSGTTPEYLDFAISRISRQGAVAYLPLGDEVMGNDELIGLTADKLEREGIIYVSAEFAKISGDAKLAGKAKHNVIRLHAAQAAELVRMSPTAIVERYVKAARERNIRYLLVRPSSTASDKPLTKYADLIDKIRDELDKKGMAAKPARPFEDPTSNPILKAALGISLVPAMLYGLLALLGARFTPQLRMIAGGVLGLLGAAAYLPAAREPLSLLAAILIPIAGFAWFGDRSNRAPILSYLGISAFSLVAGLQVAGLLTGIGYMLHLDQFTGVKLVVFFPIFGAAYVVISRIVSVHDLLARPIMWRGLITALVVLFALAFMASRTGNDNPAGVSGLELKLRNLLDRFLIVRPRTKEFMIGHPALIFGLLWWKRAQVGSTAQLIAAALISAGAIGQTSVVNTFCHLHTPIDLTVIRVVTGHVLGCIIGLLGWAVLSRILPLNSAGEDN